MMTRGIIPLWLAYVALAVLGLMSGFSTGYLVYRGLMLSFPSHSSVCLFVGLLVGCILSVVLVVQSAAAADEGARVPWYRRAWRYRGIFVIRATGIIGGMMIIYGALTSPYQRAEREREAIRQALERLSARVAEARAFEDSLRADLRRFRDRTIITRGYRPALAVLLRAQRRRAALEDSLLALERRRAVEVRPGDHVLLLADVARSVGVDFRWLVLIFVALIPLAVDVGIDRLVVYSVHQRRARDLETRLGRLVSGTGDGNGNRAGSGNGGRVILRERGSSFRSRDREHNYRINWADPVTQRIVELICEGGHSYRSIARAVGKSHTWVIRIAHALREVQDAE